MEKPAPKDNEVRWRKSRKRTKYVEAGHKKGQVMMSCAKGRADPWADPLVRAGRLRPALPSENQVSAPFIRILGGGKLCGIKLKRALHWGDDDGGVSLGGKALAGGSDGLAAGGNGCGHDHVELKQAGGDEAGEGHGGRHASDGDDGQG